MFAPTTIIGPLAIFAGAFTTAALGGRFVLHAVSGALRTTFVTRSPGQLFLGDCSAVRSAAAQRWGLQQRRSYRAGLGSRRPFHCGAKANYEKLHTEKPSDKWRFVLCAFSSSPCSPLAWALPLSAGVSAAFLLLGWFNRDSFFLSPSYDVSVAAVLGGAFYGLGTFINGGCMFGTVSRIASGKLSFLTALPGMLD